MAVHINIRYPHGQSTAYQIFAWQLRWRRRFSYRPSRSPHPPPACKRRMQIYSAAQMGKPSPTHHVQSHAQRGCALGEGLALAAEQQVRQELGRVFVGARCAWRKTWMWLSPRTRLFRDRLCQRHLASKADEVSVQFIGLNLTEPIDNLTNETSQFPRSCCAARIGPSSRKLLCCT